MGEKDLRQAEYFRNRIVKTEKQLRRWLRKEEVFAYRLYDRDIPEVPLALDLYRDAGGKNDESALYLALYDRPYDKDEAEESAWLALMATTAAEALGIRKELVFARTRKKMRGSEQYEKLGTGKAERIVREGGLSFIVNLSDYLDTGLFLDHRPLRMRVRKEAEGKRVLNLFGYTGSFSVHAAAGRAASVTTVDLSNTYLAWAGRNLALNGFSGPAWPLVRADVRQFLNSAVTGTGYWDLIVVDPPTFSNSKSAVEDFDINRDWSMLLATCSDLLAPGGTLYFSTNSRRLAWDASKVSLPSVDISEECIPPDFRDRRIHRVWQIRRA